MMLGSILNPVNSSMLAVALIPIGQAFGAPPAQTAWLVSALYLATAVGQPVIGRLVDTFGPRPLYLAGTALVGVAGVLGIFAPDLWVLVLSRVLLGFGTSAAYPASMYLLRAEADRTGMKSPSGILAALSVSNQVISAIGPTVGGLLIGLGGWQLIFGVNIPLSVACLILGTLTLPRALKGQGERQSVDPLGMLLFAAMLTAFLFFLMDPRRWYLMVVAVAAGIAFTLRENRADTPFVDLRVLRGNGPLLATYLRQLLAYTTAYAFLYGYTQWLEEGRSLSASAAGLLLLPLSLAAMGITALVGRTPQVWGKLVGGALAQVVASVALLFLGTDSLVWLLAAVGAVAGIAQGLNGLANQNALYAQADPARMGSSAGLLRTFTYVGALLASAASAAFYGHGADTSGLHGMAVLLVCVSSLLFVVTLVDRPLRRVGHDAAETV
ncbi:MFS transporter [Amycolatopsis acidicola]|uniref:MFS transporter n=2 Tax=Amycolatopsis acidicola TaxID=2596893 RepID=A0A5N0UZ48_9PSEU|nr:MFS transporter [Amycolatopsis acidicola]